MNELNSYFTFASGILGFGLPAAVGIALAQKDAGEEEKGSMGPVTALIGDGSINYTVHALWTAAQQQVPVIIFVLRNEQYAILNLLRKRKIRPKCPGWICPASTLLRWREDTTLTLVVSRLRRTFATRT